MFCLFLSIARVNAELYDVPQWMKLPFTMWFGWITLGAFIMLTTILVYAFHAPIFFTSTWAITLILISTVLAVFWLRFTAEMGYPIGRITNTLGK